MKKSTLLTLARVRIERGLNTTICAATRDVEGRHHSTGAQLRNVIMRRLAPHFTVSGWLGANVPKAHRLMDKHMTAISRGKDVQNSPWVEAQRAYRLRWIDHLIAEFNAKGQ